MRSDTISFDGGTIGDGETFVIAEAGSNHNGDLETAKELVDAAAEAGADAVKFQTFRAERHFVEDSGTIPQMEDDKSIYETLAEVEMPYDWIPELHERAVEQGILFMSTPSDEQSAHELDPYVPMFKIESFNLSNYPFLESVAEIGKPMILSAGAHTYEEIEDAVEFLESIDAPPTVLLHCVSAYPTDLPDINVRAIERIQSDFDLLSGLSDHTTDPVTAPSAAVAVGGSVVEKHFTLDNDMPGPDHDYALEPDELSEMVTAIRRTEKALGDGEIRVLEEEQGDIVRRHIHATATIEAGEQLTEDNVALLSSGMKEPGLEPKHYEEVVGRTAARDIEKDDGVTWDDLE